MNSKFKSPYFWLSVGAGIFAGAGVDFNTLTSWSLLYQAFINMLGNPVVLIAVFVNLLGVWNDNSTNGLDTFRVRVGMNRNTICNECCEKCYKH